MLAPDKPTPTSAIAVRALEQRYGETPVLRGIDFSLPKGSTLALLGPSGCGKTTLLRLIAGLLAPSQGTISIDGQVVADAATGALVPPEKRALGMVFQDYALWPHMKVADNVGFPLEMRGVAKPERKRLVAEALARVGLESLAERRPSDLSGGQQQRVAIARAIVAAPRIVLFDEPLSNLDRELRETLVGEIAQLVSSLGLTAVYVTHDHSEAFTLADQVAVMLGGRIAQLAAPETLVDRPATPAVAEFLKLGTLADAVRIDGGWRLEETGTPLPTPDRDIQLDKARVLIARKALRPATPGEVAIEGTVVQSLFRGDGYALTVALGAVQVQLASDARCHAGERIGLALDPGHLRWFAAEPVNHVQLEG